MGAGMAAGTAPSGDIMVPGDPRPVVMGNMGSMPAPVMGLIAAGDDMGAIGIIVDIGAIALREVIGFIGIMGLMGVMGVMGIMGVIGVIGVMWVMGRLVMGAMADIGTMPACSM